MQFLEGQHYIYFSIDLQFWDKRECAKKSNGSLLVSEVSWFNQSIMARDVMKAIGVSMSTFLLIIKNVYVFNYTKNCILRQ